MIDDQATIWIFECVHQPRLFLLRFGALSACYCTKVLSYVLLSFCLMRVVKYTAYCDICTYFLMSWPEFIYIYFSFIYAILIFLLISIIFGVNLKQISIRKCFFICLLIYLNVYLGHTCMWFQNIALLCLCWKVLKMNRFFE